MNSILFFRIQFHDKFTNNYSEHTITRSLIFYYTADLTIIMY